MSSQQQQQQQQQHVQDQEEQGGYLPEVKFGVEIEFMVYKADLVVSADDNPTYGQNNNIDPNTARGEWLADRNPLTNRDLLGVTDLIRGRKNEEGNEVRTERYDEGVVALFLETNGLPAATPTSTFDPDGVEVEDFVMYPDINVFYLRPGSAGPPLSTEASPWCAYWLVANDMSLNADSSTLFGKHYITFEANSPILPQQEWEAGFPRVNRALRAIVRDNHTGTNRRVHVNDSCGMHVHLSPGDDILDLLTAKKMLTLCWLVESHLSWALVGPRRLAKGEVRPFDKSWDHVFSKMEMVSPDHAYNGPTQDMRDHLPERMFPGQQHRHEVQGHQYYTQSYDPSFTQTVWGSDSFDLLYNRLIFSDLPVRLSKRCGRNGMASEFTIEVRYGPASFRTAFVNNWLTVQLALFRTAMLPSHEFRNLAANLSAIRHSIGGNGNESIRLWEPMLVAIKSALHGYLEDGIDIDIEYWRGRMQAYANANANAPGGIDSDEHGHAVLDG